LSVYLSDDGGSDVTFYALLEASSFAKHWVPFCKRFKLEPRSPAAFFKTPSSAKSHDHNYVKDLAKIHVCSYIIFTSCQVFSRLSIIPSHSVLFVEIIRRNEKASRRCNQVGCTK